MGRVLNLRQVCLYQSARLIDIYIPSLIYVKDQARMIELRDLLEEKAGENKDIYRYINDADAKLIRELIVHHEPINY